MRNWKTKEKNDAKFFSGKRNKGSGNRWYNPGDIRAGRFLVESKFTEKGSYSLSKKKLQKLLEEADFAFKTPIMSIQIQDVEVVVLFKVDWEKIKKEPPER